MKRIFILNNYGYIFFIISFLMTLSVCGQTKTETWINIKDFGAKGDGVTNDTKSIQFCLNKYKNIYIPKGVYVVDYLRVNSSNNINGESYKKTIIKSSGNINNSVIEVVSSNVSIRNIAIDGSGKRMVRQKAGDGAQCITIVKADGFKLGNCKLYDSYNKILTIVNSSNCEITNNIFDATGDLNQNQDCIQIYGGLGLSANNLIENNSFHNPVRSCIYLDLEVINTIIRNNSFYNYNGFEGAAAVIAQGYGNNLIIDNNLCDSLKYLVYIRCGYGSCTVTNNTVKNIRNSLVFVYGATDIYKLLKKTEKTFKKIEKEKKIKKKKYKTLIETLKVHNNTIGFSKHLLENSTSIVSLFGFDNCYSAYFGKISLNNNVVDENKAIVINSVLFNYLKKDDQLDTVMIENNTVKQKYSKFINTNNSYPKKLLMKNNR